MNANVAQAKQTQSGVYKPNLENAVTHSNGGLLMQKHAVIDHISGKARLDFLKNVIESNQNASTRVMYDLAFKERTKSMCDDHFAPSLPISNAEFNPVINDTFCQSNVVVWTQNTLSRLVVGSGINTAFEFGLSLHHLYGVPIIPGSAIKGLALRYANEISLDQKHCEVLFGNEKQRAYFDVMDAWICPQEQSSALAIDIVTPHHFEYQKGKQALPLDSDMPVPIQTLSAQGKFHFAIRAHTNSDCTEWLKLYRELVQNALQEFGIGARTSAGYGYFV